MSTTHDTNTGFRPDLLDAAWHRAKQAFSRANASLVLDGYRVDGAQLSIQNKISIGELSLEAGLMQLETQFKEVA